MEYFSIGMVSLVLAALFPILYVAGYQLRCLDAWSKRLERPKDRVGFFVLAATVLGFLLGCLIQPQWDRAKECKAQHQPLIPCMVL
ncbi:hypothetical protein ACEN8I_16360 [Polaromonas sp. CT11-55]